MSAPKKVLFVITTSDYGGTETYVRQLIEKLDRSRLEPIFCSLCPLGRIGDAIANTGVTTFSLNMAKGTKPLELLRAVLRLRREIDQRGIDLVLGLLYRANMLAALAGRLSKKRPAVISGQRSLNPPGAGLMVRGVQWTRGLAAHSVAVSPAVKQEMLATERLAPESITVLRNGVDLERWRRGDRASARRRFELDENAIVIAAAGRCTPVKGFHHLIDALSRVTSARDDAKVHLRIAGDGPEFERLQTLIKERGLENRARLLGRLDQDSLRELYSAADVYALTSRAEGSPNAMLEAMACACAIVATRVGGVIDIICSEKNGLLIEPEDPAALAAALETITADDELRGRLARGARERIESTFNLERMVAEHEELFERLS